jgi:putative acid phosphatase of HAD superfamily subfamily IIIB
MNCYLFDIDGTIADISHRLHHIQKTPKDWRSFFAACVDDAPIPHIIALLLRLYSSGAHIVLVSGRSDECRNQTRDWLHLQSIPTICPLYMRAAGDHRPDHVVKSELLDRIFSDGYLPIIVFEDRDQVVQMWRDRGIPCAQVAGGNF